MSTRRLRKAVSRLTGISRVFSNGSSDGATNGGDERAPPRDDQASRTPPPDEAAGANKQPKRSSSSSRGVQFVQDGGRDARDVDERGDVDDDGDRRQLPENGDTATNQSAANHTLSGMDACVVRALIAERAPVRERWVRAARAARAMRASGEGGEDGGADAGGDGGADAGGEGEHVHVAAPHGALGLRMTDAPDGAGVVVHSLAEHSPLKGRVAAGDIIVGVDDVDTQHATLELLHALIRNGSHKQRVIRVRRAAAEGSEAGGAAEPTAEVAVDDGQDDGDDDGDDDDAAAPTAEAAAERRHCARKPDPRRTLPDARTSA